MKKKIRKQKIASIIVLSLTLILSGCNKQSTEKTDEDLPNAQAQIKDDSQFKRPTDDEVPNDKFLDNSPPDNNIENADTSLDEIIEIVELEPISYEKEDLIDTWEEDSCFITLSKTSAEIIGEGAVFENGDLKIIEAGTYVINGTLTDGQILIKAGEEATVHLILNGVSISCSDSAAIYIKKTKKVILTLAENTTNYLTDGTNYVYDDIEKQEPSAALFSKCDLVINGKGTLNIDARFNDAITCKDSLLIVNGTFSIHSVDDGIIGRDKLQILDGTFLIKTQGDGFKTTNDTDETVGNLIIEGGNFTVTSQADGFQAEYALKITDGTFQILTGEGSNITSSENIESAKGLKSGTSTQITGGTFVLDCADDALHTNGSLQIIGGNFEIRTGDDGVHADSELTILGGTIQINQSYEGLEAKSIQIKDGTIYVTASDDGVNAAGGKDNSGQGGFFGMDRFSSGTAQIVIEGGYLVISAEGDGLDSNGSVIMEGGTVFINGPTNNGNGALDYDSTFTMNGGILAAAGSFGMTQSVSSGTQNCISMTFSSVQSKETTVSLKDTSGKTIFSFAPIKQFQNIVISIPELLEGESYTLYTEEKEIVSFTLSDTILWLNESGVTDGKENGWMGRPTGGRPRNGKKEFRSNQ